MYVCVPADMCCFVFAEARRGPWISWKWSYEQSLAAVWMLGIECVSSGRAASSFNSEPSLQSPTVFLFTYLFLFCAVLCRTWASGMSAGEALLPLSYVPVFEQSRPCSKNLVNFSYRFHFRVCFPSPPVVWGRMTSLASAMVAVESDHRYKHTSI